MKPASDEAYLLHIQDSIKQIYEYTKEGKEVFFRSRLIQDAVVRNLEIVGEATKQLTSEVKAHQPSIPWKQIAGMRDMLIHDYFGVDLNIVWGVVENRLPELEKAVKRLLEQS
jgi:uncharacterized protein with HEPN domain